MFARWSNDTLKSTPHRIVNSDLSRSRISMPYFVDPGRDVMIKNLTTNQKNIPQFLHTNILNGDLRNPI
ncbi:MAG: hypothetical protein CM1200mP30_11190 [Pseudomonadota bacterium]|nr:MAG: hypothetical protein CM1200mP30_11190 [Pseudomonadota bacterium]